MNDSPETAAAPQRLRPSVGVAGTAVIAMANTAPTLSIGIGLGLISLDAGAAVPAMVLLAVLPILGIALAFSRLNRAERNLGASYTWVGRTLSPWLGFQCGWVNLAGTTIYLAYGSQVAARCVLTFANECHWRSVFGLRAEPDLHRADHGRRPGRADQPDLPRAARRRRGRAAANAADRL